MSCPIPGRPLNTTRASRQEQRSPYRCVRRNRDILNVMTNLNRITRDPDVMGGRPCIRGLRVTVGMIVGLLAEGHDEAEVLAAYPYLEGDDIRQALTYAAWRTGGAGSRSRFTLKPRWGEALRSAGASRLDAPVELA